MERFQQLTETCTLGDAAELNIADYLPHRYKYLTAALFFRDAIARIQKASLTISFYS